MEKAATGSASRAVRQAREGSTGGTGATSATKSSAASGSSDRPIAASSNAAVLGAGKESKTRSAAATSTASGTTATAPNTSTSAPIKFKTTFRNTIYDTMLRRGWKETTDNDWDFYWADREYIYELLDTVHLENGQRVNHFRNGREACCAQSMLNTSQCSLLLSTASCFL
ncbi:hypothetical protein PINS_up001962 [Pythium insidiosum]|nr:hypothetical protein PINS_up001962 [Pythium insidiosum]